MYIINTIMQKEEKNHFLPCNPNIITKFANYKLNKYLWTRMPFTIIL